MLTFISSLSSSASDMHSSASSAYSKGSLLSLLISYDLESIKALHLFLIFAMINIIAAVTMNVYPYLNTISIL